MNSDIFGEDSVVYKSISGPSSAMQKFPGSIGRTGGSA